MLWNLDAQTKMKCNCHEVSCSLYIATSEKGNRTLLECVQGLVLSVSQFRAVPAIGLKPVLPHSLLCYLFALLPYSLPAFSLSSFNRQNTWAMQSFSSQSWGFTPHRTPWACLPEVTLVLSSMLSSLIAEGWQHRFCDILSALCMHMHICMHTHTHSLFT